MQEKKVKQNAGTGNLRIKAVILGIGTSLWVIAVEIGLFAVLVAAGMIPERWIDACTLLSCVAGTWIGSRIALRHRGRGVVPVCMAIALGLSLLLAVCGILIYGALDTTRLGATGMACLCGCGIAALTMKKVKKRRC